MTYTMLPQTKRIIEAVKSCGFKRSEFSARTPMNSQRSGWELTKVTFKWEAREKAIERARELAETGELDITIYRINNHSLISAQESIIGGSYQEIIVKEEA